LTGDGHTVGLLGQDRWIRDKAGHGRKHDRRQRPYSEKESYKWEAETRRCADRLGDAMSRTVVVNDRESDVYEYLQFMIHNDYRFVVRTQTNRCLSSSEECIFSHLSECPVLGHTDVNISGRGGRKARIARVTLRADCVSLKPPKRFVDQRELEEIQIWAVRVQEENPPEGEEALCWVLWTSEPAKTFSDTLEIKRLYGLRWRIEEYFKSWKSGCGVKYLRMPYRNNLQRMAAILAFVAVRLLQLKEWSADEPESPCTHLLSENEWKCLWYKNEKGKPFPNSPPTTRWAFYAVAKLGGWIDTRRTGRVGWEALWVGWARLTDMIETIQFLKEKL